MKIRFLFNTKAPLFQQSAVAPVKGATKSFLIELTPIIKREGISLQELLILADQARKTDWVKYGNVPFIGNLSKQPYIYEGIETSKCGKLVISGLDAITSFSNVEARDPDTITWFLVTDNRETAGDDDAEVPADAETFSNVKLSFFFFGITDEAGEVRIPVSASHRTEQKSVRIVNKEGLTGKGKLV